MHGEVEALMASHHPKFEEHRYLGDKRSFLLYDTEDAAQLSIMIEVPLEKIASFGPDTPEEAMNRGFRLSPEFARSHAEVSG